MREALLLLLIVASAGCGDNGSGAPMDLALGNADLAVPGGADLAALSCNGIFTCAGACTSTMSTSCAQACLAAGTPMGQAKFQTVAICFQKMCATPDGGTGPCVGAGASTSACTECVTSKCASQIADCQAN
jgi:hypothetical protein